LPVRGNPLTRGGRDVCSALARGLAAALALCIRVLGRGVGGIHLKVFPEWQLGCASLNAFLIHSQNRLRFVERCAQLVAQTSVCGFFGGLHGPH
jgi:hypothetical protein